jgi:hypothetical protein
VVAKHQTTTWATKGKTRSQPVGSGDGFLFFSATEQQFSSSTDKIENGGRGSRPAGISPAMETAPREGPGSPARLLATPWGSSGGLNHGFHGYGMAARREQGPRLVTRAEEKTRGDGHRGQGR